MTNAKPIDQAAPLLAVGEVARRSGVPVSTLHFYESRGLIQGLRSHGNQRRYPPVVLRYIAIIKVAQRAGLGLQEIQRALAQYPPNSRLSSAQWKALSEQWREQLDKRIDRLTRLRDTLDHCIGCGCLSLTECPLRNPGDVLGGQGSGPRLLDPC